jgi:DNA invertase Pin-like site-specific DNA recombinase
VTRAVGYVRVSTEDQARSGLGLEDQRAAIKAAAERLRLQLIGIHADEGLSGGLEASERPGLMAALGELKRGDVLLVAKGGSPREGHARDRAP